MIWATVGNMALCWRSACRLTQAQLTRSARAVNAPVRLKIVAVCPGFYDLMDALGDPTHEQHDEL